MDYQRCSVVSIQTCLSLLSEYFQEVCSTTFRAYIHVPGDSDTDDTVTQIQYDTELINKR